MLNLVRCDLKVCIVTIFVIVDLQNFSVVCRYAYPKAEETVLHSNLIVILHSTNMVPEMNLHIFIRSVTLHHFRILK
jgi:hypothetical protein